MRNDFLDLVKKGREHKRTVILDGDDEAGGCNELANLADPEIGLSVLRLHPWHAASIR